MPEFSPGVVWESLQRPRIGSRGLSRVQIRQIGMGVAMLPTVVETVLNATPLSPHGPETARSWGHACKQNDPNAGVQS